MSYRTKTLATPIAARAGPTPAKNPPAHTKPRQQAAVTKHPTTSNRQAHHPIILHQPNNTGSNNSTTITAKTQHHPINKRNTIPHLPPVNHHTVRRHTEEVSNMDNRSTRARARAATVTTSTRRHPDSRRTRSSLTTVAKAEDSSIPGSRIIRCGHAGLSYVCRRSFLSSGMTIV